MKEIEKKYKVVKIPENAIGKEKRIVQSYIYYDGITTIRKRMTKQDEVEKYFYTIKTKVDIEQENTMTEIETTISKEQYESLKIVEDTNEINKTRIIIELEEGLKAELDIFHGEYEGVVTVEVEFENEEMMKKFNPPDWFGEELDPKEFSNRRMTQLEGSEKKEFLDFFKKAEPKM